MNNDSILKISEAEIKAYLHRIGFSDSPNIDTQTLHRLHALHVQNVPFETLDILENKPFNLDYKSLFKKIVVRRRGGYCYELNTLYFYLLKSLGFDAALVSANVYDQHGVLISDSQHMAIVVRLEREWLVDVGYGNGFISPLLLNDPNPQIQGHRSFQCIYQDGKYRVQEFQKNCWRPWYAFTLEPMKVVDFEDRNYFHQTNKESVFYGKRICMLVNERDSLELIGNTLIKISAASTQKIIVREEDIPQLLANEFSIQKNLYIS